MGIYCEVSYIREENVVFDDFGDGGVGFFEDCFKVFVVLFGFFIDCIFEYGIFGG